MKRIYKIIRATVKDKGEAEGFENDLNAATSDGYRIESSGVAANGWDFWAILSRPARMRPTVPKELKRSEMEAIRAMADADMNLSSAARELGIHRDTLRSQLDAIAKRTGLNPMNFYDLSELLYPED